jgi:hypothetical protein
MKPRILNTNKSELRFTGFTNALRTRPFVFPSNIEKISDVFVKSDGFYGNLPYFEIQNIPKENRKDTVLNINQTFREIAIILRNHKRKKAQEKITNIITERNLSNIISNIRYIDEGDYGKGYYFELNGKAKFLKIFKNRQEMNDHFHGSYIEGNRGLYWNKKAPNCQFVKIHCGDIKEGWLIADYIPDDISYPKKIVIGRSIGLNLLDLHYTNMKNSHVFDFGGQRVNSLLLNNKEYQKLIKEFIKKPKDERIKELLNEVYPEELLREFKLAWLEELYYVPKKNYLNEYYEALKMANITNDSEIKYILKLELFKLGLKDIIKLGIRLIQDCCSKVYSKNQDFS